MGKYFTLGFAFVFCAVIVSLVFIYSKLSSGNVESGVLSVFWSIITFLFLLFGIIIISLFVKSAQEKSGKK